MQKNSKLTTDGIYGGFKTIVGEGTARNEAGGDVYRVDQWVQLERFLVLGSIAGGYYTTPEELTIQSLENVRQCLASDGLRALRMVTDVSVNRRAARQDPVLLVLAGLFNHSNVHVRQEAARVLPQIARTGTHLFTFLSYVTQIRGWGRTLRTAVSRWYGDKEIDVLVNLLIKYQQRGGWSNRDVLRLVHTHPRNTAQDAVFFWAVGGDISKLKAEFRDAMHPRIYAMEALKLCKPMADGLRTAELLIRANQLPREAVPTELLSYPSIWAALIDGMLANGLDEALLRNLGRVSSLGMLDNGEMLRRVVHYLGNVSRAHPIKVLTAMNQYRQEHGNFRNNEGEYRNTWRANAAVLEALDAAFYRGFKYVQPSNKRIMLALDISGSMKRSRVSGLDYMTTCQAAACLGMIFLRTEPKVTVVGYNKIAQPLEIDPEIGLTQFAEYIHRISNGSTNCSAPLQYIAQNRLPIDGIINITDTQHWDGPACGPELTKARQATGLAIQHATIAMVPTRWTLSNPNDALSIDAVGYDANVPRLIQQFMGGSGLDSEE